MIIGVNNIVVENVDLETTAKGEQLVKHRGRFSVLETQGTVLCVVYSSTILRTIVRLSPVRREIWRRDRC